VNEVGSWTFGATDPDGNLSRWRFYASTNGNPQWAAASGSSVSDTYTASFGVPGTYRWNVDVEDSAGASAAAEITVNVTAVPPVSASITASPGSVVAPGSTTISWSTSNATSVSVSGSAVSSSAASGSQLVSGLGAGTYIYTLTAQGDGGPIVRTATVTVAAGASRTVTTSVSPAGAGTAGGAGTYVQGSAATLTAAPNASHVFTGWSGDVNTASNPFTFVVGPQDYNVVANFALRTYAVTVSVSPAGSGSVSGAGSYPMGATATLVATPTTGHVFTGWSGDIAGSANPMSFAVNGNAVLTANFATASFTLTTSAGAGGSVTPGGTYPAGTVVTISASPEATHRFAGWSGDASGAAPTVAVTLDRAKVLQASFIGKAAQTILFAPPGDHALTSQPFVLTASATSELPVSFSLLSGPAVLTGNSVQVTGAGPVTIQASQPGDAFFLPATPVSRSFNVIAGATLRYRGQSRTLLRDATTRDAPPFVLEKP
jgi:uncharacterized repeat protein (TIGR02543 family)